MTNNDKIDDLPQLVPYNKNRYIKEQPISQAPILIQQPKPQIPQINTNDLMYNIFNSNLAKSNEPSPRNAVKPIPSAVPSAAKDLGFNKLEQIKKKNADRAARMDRDIKPIEDTTDMEVHKTNKMINQMINKTATKNVADQIFPVSLQTINKNIEELRKEVEELRDKAIDVQNQLDSNPKNTELQTQKKNIQQYIQKLEVMRYLYLDKIDMRSQNKRLLQVIQKLKQENMEIRGRVIQGMQRIEGQMHHLPCQREKNLMIQLQRTKKELQKEKKMRENLESKVQNTIQDFARLYEQADIARKIIVNKLKEIEFTQQQAQNGFLSVNNNNNKGNGIYVQKPSRNLSLEDSAERYDNITSRIGAGLGDKTGTKMDDSDQKQDTTIRKAPSTLVPSREMNMEDKINKMRNNQVTFKKMKF